MLGVAVPADVGSSGEPADRDGVRLSTLQNFGLGLAPEVHVPVEVGDPMDLLAHRDAPLASRALTWVSGRKQPLLSALGLLRNSRHAEASSSWSRRSLALLRPLLLCLLVLLFLVVLLFLLVLFLLVRALFVLFCLVKRCNTQCGVHGWGHRTLLGSTPMSH